MKAGRVLAAFAATAFLSGLGGLSGRASAAPYDTVVQTLRDLAASAPDYVTMIDIGVNDQGTTLYGVRIEAPNPEGAARANHLVVATHHGNEEGSTDVAVQFAKNLVTTLQDASAADHDALSQSAIYVVPVLNVTGYNISRREEKSRSNGYLDPNRDYPDPCTTDTPFVLASTKALADFVGREDIVASVTVHGYIGVFTYPWGIFTNETSTQDDVAFKALARPVVAVNGYDTGTSADAIYPTAGAFEDWAYFEHGVWSMLMEVASRGNVDRDARALLKYFAVAPRVRSEHHAHLGECTNVPFTVMARP